MTTQRTITAILTIFIFIFIIPSLYSFASSLNTITIGKNINSNQQKEILDFFNPSSDTYTLLNIKENDLIPYRNLLKNTTENKHLSCAYVQPTNEGGINIKTINLTYITNYLLSNALITSGIDNLNAVIASPSQISGLYSFPSIILAYENCTGKTIAPEKIKLSISLMDLILKISSSEDISQTRLSMVFAIIENDIIQGSDVSNTVNSTLENHDIALSTTETDDIVDLMTEIQQQSYNKSSTETSLDELTLKIKCKLQKNGQLYGLFNNIYVFLYRAKSKIEDYFSSSNSSNSIFKTINENSTLAQTAVHTGDSTLVDILN
ncbi:DUF1002 domain-containing protein [uncultured Clostridium sp.]|uniref:DUF1002 domain-containing protein n=1 Tax=uncultured Clostridium sp. TaxID=59620 RepID=UPI002603A24B|nr:DUF1002 domain-containing protein [uncultured Clostridium sp.]